MDTHSTLEMESPVLVRSTQAVPISRPSQTGNRVLSLHQDAKDSRGIGEWKEGGAAMQQEVERLREEYLKLADLVVQRDMKIRKLEGEAKRE